MLTTAGCADGLAIATTCALIAGACVAYDPPEGGRGPEAIANYGHRGARGRYPENTRAGCLAAVAMGATHLELDLAVSADGLLVLSHEPHFRRDICGALPEGVDEATSLFSLPYAAIAQVECGEPIAAFPAQAGVAEPKPLLADVVAAVDALVARTRSDSVAFLLELKSGVALDGVYAPPPRDYVALVTSALDELDLRDRSTVQSFDMRLLRELHHRDPELSLGWLDAYGRTLESGCAELGFVPDVYAPYHLWLTPARVARARARGVRVVPWTVNDVSRMRELITWGVDGIITDYPDRLARIRPAVR